MLDSLAGNACMNTPEIPAPPFFAIRPLPYS
jgi:hypothetical protein